eukprot:82908_1
MATEEDTKTSSSVWWIGDNKFGQFGTGNKKKQKELVKCDWSCNIQVTNLYCSLLYTVVENWDDNYYATGYNGDGACTVNDKSDCILNMTPITYFKDNNIKISQVFINKRGDAPFWKADDGLIYTSCDANILGRVGVKVDGNKAVNKIPFLSQLSIKKMVSGYCCSIAICNDGSVYST